MENKELIKTESKREPSTLDKLNSELKANGYTDIAKSYLKQLNKEVKERHYDTFLQSDKPLETATRTYYIEVFKIATKDEIAYLANSIKSIDIIDFMEYGEKRLNLPERWYKYAHDLENLFTALVIREGIGVKSKENIEAEKKTIADLLKRSKANTTTAKELVTLSNRKYWVELENWFKSIVPTVVIDGKDESGKPCKVKKPLILRKCDRDFMTKAVSSWKQTKKGTISYINSTQFRKVVIDVLNAIINNYDYTNSYQIKK